MNIRWIDGQRELSNHGIVNTDDVIDVPNEMAKSLIKQGQAITIKLIKTEKKKKENN